MSKKPEASEKNKTPLLIQLDPASRKILADAARLRKISLSDFVHDVALAQAKEEVGIASENILRLSPNDQLCFWNALSAPVILTSAQMKLAKMMQGKS